MKLTVTLCQTTLIAMLLNPEKFEQAVWKYEATAPAYTLEGINGYMEIVVTFHVKDLTLFTRLWEESYKLPSDRSDWYNKIRTGYFVKD